MRLELSRFVEGDLDDIACYSAQDNPRRAVSYIREVRADYITSARIRCSISSAPTLERKRA